MQLINPRNSSYKNLIKKKTKFWKIGIFFTSLKILHIFSYIKEKLLCITIGKKIGKQNRKLLSQWNPNFSLN